MHCARWPPEVRFGGILVLVFYCSSVYIYYICIPTHQYNSHSNYCDRHYLPLFVVVTFSLVRSYFKAVFQLNRNTWVRQVSPGPGGFAPNPTGWRPFHYRQHHNEGNTWWVSSVEWGIIRRNRFSFICCWREHNPHDDVGPFQNRCERTMCFQQCFWSVGTIHSRFESDAFD